MKKTIFAALILIWAAVLGNAQQFSADDLARRSIERRAVEAVIWGMPAVNTELMYDQMFKAGGKVNQIIYWGSRQIPTRSTSWAFTTPRSRGKW
jgi:hypothetical protein